MTLLIKGLQDELKVINLLFLNSVIIFNYLKINFVWYCDYNLTIENRPTFKEDDYLGRVIVETKWNKSMYTFFWSWFSHDLTESF